VFSPVKLGLFKTIGKRNSYTFLARNLACVENLSSVEELGIHCTEIRINEVFTEREAKTDLGSLCPPSLDLLLSPSGDDIVTINEV
jgi:hypothetical protein